MSHGVCFQVKNYTPHFGKLSSDMQKQKKEKTTIKIGSSLKNKLVNTVSPNLHVGPN